MEREFKVFIVGLILDGKTEKALKLLAEHYSVDVPEIKVGLPKGRKRKAFGCYNAKKRVIFVLNSDVFKHPFIILHEFYHHLRRTLEAKHKGTEKYANEFAEDFIQAYNSVTVKASGNS